MKCGAGFKDSTLFVQCLLRFFFFYVSCFCMYGAFVVKLTSCSININTVKFSCVISTWWTGFKGELGEFQIFFRKIPLHQQKFLVVSVLSNLRWLLRNLKNVQNETTKLFSVGNAFSNASIATMLCMGFFVSVARWHELDQIKTQYD